jgi:hypothetical protein
MPIWRVLRPRVTLGTVELGFSYPGQYGELTQARHGSTWFRQMTTRAAEGRVSGNLSSSNSEP